MPRVLIADGLGGAGLAILRSAEVEIREVAADEKGRLGELVAECDALVVRSTTRVTAELLAASARLRVVGRAGIGVDNIDVEAATRLGIVVVNAPTANLVSAAEHTFALLLALARQVPAAWTSLREGVWDRQAFVGRELAGRCLGLVGFGRIARLVAARARAFEMSVVACDPYLEDETFAVHGVRRCELADLLAVSDVVSLHLPATAETRNLLGAAELDRMRPGAFLVNCARGGIVDEAALFERLESGRVGGAALDVFEEEPTPRLDLVRHPRVVATPHLGARTVEAQERMSVEVARQVLLALAGSPEASPVNRPPRPRLPAS